LSVNLLLCLRPSRDNYRKAPYPRTRRVRGWIKIMWSQLWSPWKRHFTPLPRCRQKIFQTLFIILYMNF